jgi:hypothetical protein
VYSGSTRFGRKWLFYSFSFSFFLDLCAGHAENQNGPLIVFFFIQSLFSYLQFFLHWLFLIGFYFLFHSWSFDFLILFSNLVLILWIAIYFILNCFLNLFVFLQFHPRYFFHLIFASNLVMFLLVAIFISFLMDWFFTISSLHI